MLGDRRERPDRRRAAAERHRATVASAPPVVHEWLALFASPPIRNRATLGGNLATASPIGDAAPLLLALDASVHIAGPRRPADACRWRRSSPAIGRRPCSAARCSPPSRFRSRCRAFVRFYKVAKRRLDDISTVAAAMALDRDHAGRVRRARFAFGGVAATPLRVGEAEQRRRPASPGTRPPSSACSRCSSATLTPMSDHRGSKEYRLEVSKSLVEKFWWESRA